MANAHIGKLGIRTASLALSLALLGACHLSPMKDEAHDPLYLGSSTAPDRVPGEYIMTVSPGAGEEVLRRQYRIYGIRKITALGANMFLVKLGNDPGLDAVQRKAAESGKVEEVQPNYIYRGNR